METQSAGGSSGAAGNSSPATPAQSPVEGKRPREGSADDTVRGADDGGAAGESTTKRQRSLDQATIATTHGEEAAHQEEQKEDDAEEDDALQFAAASLEERLHCMCHLHHICDLKEVTAPGTSRWVMLEVEHHPALYIMRPESADKGPYDVRVCSLSAPAEGHRWEATVSLRGEEQLSTEAQRVETFLEAHWGVIMQLKAEAGGETFSLQSRWAKRTRGEQAYYTFDGGESESLSGESLCLSTSWVTEFLSYIL